MNNLSIEKLEIPCSQAIRTGISYKFNQVAPIVYHQKGNQRLFANSSNLTHSFPLPLNCRVKLPYMLLKLLMQTSDKRSRQMLSMCGLRGKDFRCDPPLNCEFVGLGWSQSMLQSHSRIIFPDQLINDKSSPLRQSPVNKIDGCMKWCPAEFNTSDQHSGVLNIF